jgi:hypothetical protein
VLLGSPSFHCSVCRGWYYHKEYKAWLTRAPNTEPLQKTDRCGGRRVGRECRKRAHGVWGVVLALGVIGAAAGMGLG